MDIYSNLLEKTENRCLHRIIVSGPPGIGKSRLLEEFGKKAWQKKLRVFSASLSFAFPGNSRKIWQTLAGVTYPPGLKSEKFSFQTLYSKALENLRQVCSDSPCVVIIDNLHLGGKSFFSHLYSMLEEFSAYPLLFVASYQDIPASLTEAFLLFLSEIKGLPHTLQFRLGGFNDEEVFLLAEKLTGHRYPDMLVNKIHSATGGNPLFAQEMIYYLSANLSNDRTTGACNRETGLPVSAAMIIRYRLKKLSPCSLDILEKCSLVGYSFYLSQLVLLLPDFSAEQLLFCLTECLNHGFLKTGEENDFFFFTHSIIHSAVSGQIPAEKKLIIYSQFVGIVEKLSCVKKRQWYTQLSSWYRNFSDPFSLRKFRDYTQKAADCFLGNGFYDKAAEFYEKIVESGSVCPRNRNEADAFLGLGVARANTAMLPEAIKNLKNGLNYYCEKNDVEKLIKMFSLQGYFFSGYDDFNSYLKRALEKNREESLTRARLQLCYGINCITGTGDYKKAEKAITAAREISKKKKNRLVYAASLVVLSILDYTYKKYSASFTKLEKAMKIPDVSGEKHLLNTIFYGRAILFLESGKYEEAVQDLEKIFSGGKKSMDNLKTGIAVYLRARLQFQVGNYEFSREILDSGLASCPGHLSLLFHRAISEYTIGSYSSGEYYSRKLNSIKRSTPSGPYLVHVFSAAVSLINAYLSCNVTAAKTVIREIEGILSFPSVHPFIQLRCSLLLCIAGIMTGSTELVRKHSRIVLSFLGIHLIRPYLAFRVLGLSHGYLGDTEAAAEYFKLALEFSQKYNDLVMEAWIYYDFGKTLAKKAAFFALSPTENTSQALHYLQKAAEMAEKLKIENLRELATEFRGCCSFNQQAAIFPVSLSRREKEVLALVSEGLTNGKIAEKLHISVFTVANHIHNLLEKTGSSNRTEAASWLQKNTI